MSTSEIKTTDYIKTLEIPEEKMIKFTWAKNIQNPRERYLQFMAIHEKVHSNFRKWRFGMIESPNCMICHQLEDVTHIFTECQRSQDAWATFTEVTQITLPAETITNGSPDKWLNNLISITKLELSKDRNVPINTELLKSKLKSRIEDLKVINDRKAKDKNIRARRRSFVRVEI